MDFYKQLSRFYDMIFPAGSRQLSFIKESAGLPPKSILDVASGSGGYSIELARAGYYVTAVDLDDEMVELTRLKASREGLGVKAAKCDMRELSSRLTPGFDCVFCIGNSLVHLRNQDEIRDALRQMFELLAPGGVIVLQIINFDRVLKYNISELPAIRNEDAGLNFIRRYNYLKNKNLIEFNTTLIVDEGGSTAEYENTVELFPLLSKDLAEMLANTGFIGIQLFGDFDSSPFLEDSFMLVVKAVK